MSCTVHDTIQKTERRPVTVNETEISHDAISVEVQNHAADSPTKAWSAAARALVVREALLQEAHRLGISSTPLDDDQGRRETDEESLIRQLVEKEIHVPDATEAECKRYYEQNQRRFQSPDIYEAAHILFSASKADASEYEKQKTCARAVLQDLNKNSVRFAELAKELSDCPSAEHGGNLGQLTSGQTTPEFEAALQKMEAGELSSEPVESRYGHHIIYLERKINGALVPFESVHGRIVEFLSERSQRFASAQYIARLVAKSNVRGVEMPSRQDLRVF